MSGHRAHRGAALGVAAGGVLLGHWATYRLVSPDAHARSALLARTGHAYLGLANDLGLALALFAVATVFLGRVVRRGEPGAGIGRWFARLVAFQLGAFAGMEVLERLSSGTPLAELLSHGLLPTGAAVQLAVAGLGALLVAWLLRAADRVGALGGRAAVPSPRAALARIPAPGLPGARSVALATAGIRGPPPR